MKQQAKAKANQKQQVVVQEEETNATQIDEEDEVPAFREIEVMQDHGINMADIQKLK